MLVLSRRINEVIKIGDHIDVMVIDIRSGVVRLGIDAPTDIPIHRLEVWDVIHKERKPDSEDVVDS